MKKRSRKNRRQTNMHTRSKGKFVRRHKRKGGRTGSSKPGRTFEQGGPYVPPVKKPRPRAFVCGGWCLVDKVVDTIEAQEQLERVGALREGSPPEMDPAERVALERVHDACKAEQAALLRACTGHEAVVVEAWRGNGPTVREALKAVLTDRDIGRGGRRTRLAAIGIR